MQTLLERWYFTRRTVGTNHDLLLLIVERVERVEELFLRAFLAGHELDVVNQQHVDRAILLAKALRLVVTNRIDQIVHETFRRDVTKLEMLIAGFDSVTTRVHQVRFAEPHAAVEIKWVVGSARR